MEGTLGPACLPACPYTACVLCLLCNVDMHARKVRYMYKWITQTSAIKHKMITI